MDESSKKPESLFHIVGWRSDGSRAILNGGMTAQEAAAWFMQHFELDQFSRCTIESEQEWPPSYRGAES